MSYQIAPGGLAAVLAHPDDESFGCAGALALAHAAGKTTRLLVATRGEAGTADGIPDASFGDTREAELICAARTIGLDEVSILDGYADGGIADEPFDRLVDEIAAWLADRRPAAVITFGPHGVTGHPDHVVVGSATRWAVEKLSESGVAPNAIYVISPIFDPGGNLYDLSAEEQAATHRIEITGFAPDETRCPRVPRQPDRYRARDRRPSRRHRVGGGGLRGLPAGQADRSCPTPRVRRGPALAKVPLRCFPALEGILAAWQSTPTSPRWTRS